MIRKPAVGGIFYPSEKKELSALVDSYLKKAKKFSNLKTVKILIVPHAGLQFSGQTAAWGYKQLNKSYQRIILLGASHSAEFFGAAIWNQGSWETPLGLVKVDDNFAKGLINPNFQAHISEHSLEVQLPFLQRILSNFKIVPILLGQTNDFFIKDFSKTLMMNIDSNDLLLVSSDLSHYPNYKTAFKVDNETINSILTGDVELFRKSLQKNTGKNGVQTCACGARAIEVAMHIATLKKIKKISKLDYSNSGDAGADKKRVVGYTAICFCE